MNYKIIFSILIFVIIFIFCSNNVNKITKVEILDINFKKIKTISGGEDLLLFNRIWRSKTKVSSVVNEKFIYKIDIYEEGRWLYDPDGWVKILSKGKTPIYKIENVEKFNILLGIHKP